MSEQDTQTRLSEVERELVVQGKEQARQGEELRSVRTDLGSTRAEIASVGADVKKLLEHKATQPDLSVMKVLTIASATIAVVYSVWAGGNWLVAHAPSVTNMDARLQSLEWKQGWASRIEKGN